MISMSCTGCGAKLKAPDNAAGKRMTCPKCGTVLDVPEPVYEAEVIPAAEDRVDPYGFDDDQPVPLAAAPKDEARRPCPMCGEMIVRSAAKCRFCGEVFDPTLKKAEKKKKKRSKSYSSDEEDMTTGDWVAAIICSNIGCIAGIVWMVQGKPKGKKMIAVSFVCSVIWSIVWAITRSNLELQR